MLTPEMVVEALATSHAQCQSNREDGTGDCIHADALAGASEDILERLNLIRTGAALELVSGGDPMLYIFVTVMHMGYRLRVIEEAAEKNPALAATTAAAGKKGKGGKSAKKEMVN